MAINLLNIQPHKVSRDLSGYITYIYGAPKTGKTTLATQMPGSLLLAFEKGYNALPGVMAQDVTSWADMKQIYRELKKPEVKAVFNAIIIDTIDIAAEMCQKYICNQLGIDNMGDGGWGTNSWSKFKTEFSDMFRSLTQLGYAVFFLGHEKETSVKDPTTGVERMVIRPALANSVKQKIEGMADIYGYAHQKAANEMSVITLRCGDDSIACGGRFKYIKNEFPMSYEALVHEVEAAIDKEAAEHGNMFVTDEREAAVEITTYDYEALMAEFQELAGTLMNKNANLYGPKITAIIERYLGKGKKISEASVEQAEFIYLINNEVKEDLMTTIE